MTSCEGRSDYLNSVKPVTYNCNNKEYPEDVKRDKLISILLEREGGYELFDQSSVSGETYRGIDRKNGVSAPEFWAAVDRKVDEYISSGKNTVTYTGTHVTEEYKARHGNKKVKGGTIFDNDAAIKQMAIDIYAKKYYTPNRINLIKNPMIAGHSLSQAAHYGAGKTTWLQPLVNAINAVCGTNIQPTRVITDEMLRLINSDKACEIANKYTEFRRCAYSKSNQTQYIVGWLNMVNGWVTAVNKYFK